MVGTGKSVQRTPDGIASEHTPSVKGIAEARSSYKSNTTEAAYSKR
jgi:hypothetical protein